MLCVNRGIFKQADTIASLIAIARKAARIVELHIWQVQYNGENRTVLWTCTQSNNKTITNSQTISMSFDRMGCRVTKNDQRFVYNGYLQIANFDSSPTNSQYLGGTVPIREKW